MNELIAMPIRFFFLLLLLEEFTEDKRGFFFSLCSRVAIRVPLFSLGLELKIFLCPMLLCGVLMSCYANTVMVGDSMLVSVGNGGEKMNRGPNQLSESIAD